MAPPRLAAPAWKHPVLRLCAAIGALQRSYGDRTAAYGLGVVAERHGRVGVAGDLRDKADLDALLCGVTYGKPSALKAGTQ